MPPLPPLESQLSSRWKVGSPKEERSLSSIGNLSALAASCFCAVGVGLIERKEPLAVTSVKAAVAGEMPCRPAVS